MTPALSGDTEIQSAIEDMSGIIRAGVLGLRGLTSPLFIPALTSFVTIQSDCFTRMEILHGVSCLEIGMGRDKGEEVSLPALIRASRNSLNHTFSNRHNCDGHKITRNVLAGKTQIQIGGNVFGGEYEDDVWIGFGETHIYLMRDVDRAHTWLVNQMK